MTFFPTWCVAILLLVVIACEAFQWTDTVENNAVVPACAGQDASLPWTFHLESGETIQDIRWNYRQGARDDEMVATYIAGNFLPMPAFSQRVKQSTNGGIVLSHVTLGSSGNYSVDVDVRDAASVVTGYTRNAYVDIADTFHLTQEPEAVYDTTTDSWHIVLRCGMVAKVNLFNEDVSWQTPSGDLPSTKYENGYFYLHLPNPVKGGNYTCILPANVTATACVSTGAGLSPQSSIFVDEVKTRLTLLEAKTSRLESEKVVLKEKTSLMENQLKQYHEMASRRVSFHVRLSSDLNLFHPSHVILDYIYTNEAGAYDKTTGLFTVPVSGSYVLYASTGAWGDNSLASLDIMVDNDWVCFLQSERTDDGAQSCSCQAVVHLMKGQRVWLQTDSGYNRYHYSVTYFGGILVSPDE